MSKKERQAYRRGVLETLGSIAVIGFYVAIFIGYFVK